MIDSSRTLEMAVHIITPPYLDSNSHEALYEIDVAALYQKLNSAPGDVQAEQALKTMRAGGVMHLETGTYTHP